MRRLIILVVLSLLPGCPDSQLAASFGGDDGYGSGAAAAECATASDCAFGAAKCCDCPTYAAPKSDPAINACAGVMCPGSTCPQNVALACNAGRCELACAPMACDLTCADGFALDANGCLSCECAQVATRACAADQDCAEAPADCCGCANGGRDTAVPAAELGTYLAGRGCPPAPSCPGNDSCDATEGPACVQGACDLVAPAPANACGRADLAACAATEHCVVNADSTAASHGLGVCQPLP
ncbi:MAG: hypothetical protein ABI467_31095 [Kofleriaceae bacterium]